MKTLNDPLVRLDNALSAFGGKKARLARAIGLERSTVTAWVNEQKLQYVPAIHAYRLLRNYPDLVKEEQAQG